MCGWSVAVQEVHSRHGDLCVSKQKLLSAEGGNDRIAVVAVLVLFVCR